jgi:hypothetical protein
MVVWAWLIETVLCFWGFSIDLKSLSVDLEQREKEAEREAVIMEQQLDNAKIALHANKKLVITKTIKLTDKENKTLLMLAKDLRQQEPDHKCHCLDMNSPLIRFLANRMGKHRIIFKGDGYEYGSCSHDTREEYYALANALASYDTRLADVP